MDKQELWNKIWKEHHKQSNLKDEYGKEILRCYINAKLPVVTSYAEAHGRLAALYQIICLLEDENK